MRRLVLVVLLVLLAACAGEPLTPYTGCQHVLMEDWSEVCR